MKRKFYWFVVVLLISTILRPGELFSNNLTISNITYSLAGSSTVTFDLSWDNGWHNKTANNHNWDAAWIFVKFRDCASPSAAYTHGQVSTTLSDHNFNVLNGATTYEPAKSDGTVGIDASPDNTGIMLRNAADPSSGTFNARVTLKISNLPTSGSLDLNVFGIEMVFVPKGDYTLGDATYFNYGSGSYFFSQPYNCPPYYTISCYSPFVISSENAQNVREINQNYCSTGGYCNLGAAFQKGYNSFYMMKYEISQGQYVDFLNTASQVAKMVHYTYNFNNYRHSITYVSPQYVANRPDRACNWLSWSDLTAYLDWAALRPLSELEYEKAARGPYGPSPYYEMAWGNTYQSGYYAQTISGTENGTETISQGYNPNFGFSGPANINAQSGSFSGGDGGQGPVRCGIFATNSTNTRAQTGMGYYGAMELSGNICEYYVSVKAGDTNYGGVSVNGLGYGDGNLDATGNQNVSSWPSPQPSPQQYIIKRGGGWNDSFTSCAVSNRDLGSDPNRNNSSGGRGGR